MPILPAALQTHLPRVVHQLTTYRDLDVRTDVPYADRPGCSVDLLRPPGDDVLPLVVHVHGGAFRVFSKDTHGHVAARYARQGAVVVNVDYRLAPDHPYPAAVVDVHEAVGWALDHAAELGADPSRLLLTGESAGANLVLGALISTTVRRPEPWAAPLFERGIVPRAAHVVYGFLQASDVGRFDPTASAVVRHRLRVIQGDYLGVRTDHPYADPLLLLETLDAPERPLPAVLVPWGTADPIASDSERLVRALERLEAPVHAHPEPGAGHAYHALPGRKADNTWRVMLAHAREHLGAA